MSLIIKDNFLNKQQCEWLINFHSHYFNEFGAEFEGRQIIDLSNIINCLSKDQTTDQADPLKILTYCIDTEIRSIAQKTFINYHQIVKWPAGQSQPSHKDFNYHTWTSIIYLNDDFLGGNTVVGDKQITPKQGQMITFSGSEVEHEVLPILEGDRYTVAVWYKSYV